MLYNMCRAKIQLAVQSLGTGGILALTLQEMESSQLQIEKEGGLRKGFLKYHSFYKMFLC